MLGKISSGFRAFWSGDDGAFEDIDLGGIPIGIDSEAGSNVHHPHAGRIDGEA